MTDAEKLLWSHLRVRQLDGLKFRRQHPIGKYVVDFVCLSEKTIIEVDGGQHAKESEKDLLRDKWLKEEGYIVLRYWNDQVLKEIDNVLDDIVNKMEITLPQPLPSREGRKSN